MDAKLRMYLAELIGTFVLVFVGAATVCASQLASEPRLGVTAIALAEGCALAVLLTATFAVSPGCLNPAVPLMLWVFKRLEGMQTVVLIFMQLVGAVLAGLAVRYCFAVDVLRAADLGTPHLKAFVGSNNVVTIGSLLSGIGVETVCTFLVVVAIFATLLDRRAPQLGGIVVGLAQAAVILVGFRLTGGAANPARWFGTVVWQLTVPNQPGSPFADHTVYWVGPVLGALLGGFFYTAVVLPPEKGGNHPR